MSQHDQCTGNSSCMQRPCKFPGCSIYLPHKTHMQTPFQEPCLHVSRVSASLPCSRLWLKLPGSGCRLPCPLSKEDSSPPLVCTAISVAPGLVWTAISAAHKPRPSLNDLKQSCLCSPIPYKYHTCTSNPQHPQGTHTSGRVYLSHTTSHKAPY